MIEAHHLDFPLDHVAGLLIFDFEKDESMRVRLIEFLHGPIDRDAMVAVVHRRGVVRARSADDE